MSVGRRQIREALAIEPGWTSEGEGEPEDQLERLTRLRDEAEDRCYALLLVREGGR